MYKKSFKNYNTKSNSSFRPFSKSNFTRGPRKPFVKRENTFGYNKDSMITAPEVVVIDIDGNNLGIVNTRTAIENANDEGYALVEVSPNAKPPVCKVVDWDKFRYDKQKKQSTSSKPIEQKILWIGVNSGVGDINVKINRALEFFEKKHPVKIEVRAKRGRVTNDMFTATMQKIIAGIGANGKVDAPPKFEGNRRYSVSFLPNTSKKDIEQSEITSES